MRHTATAALAVGAATIALSPAATAQPAAPGPGSPCPAAAEDALTKSGGESMVLQCNGGRWAVFADPYPSGDWVSTGPVLRLHGQGMRNPEMLSGRWTGAPLQPDQVCRVEQRAVVSAGEVGAPQVAQSQPGQTLDFQVLPVMFSIELSGNCLWQAG